VKGNFFFFFQKEEWMFLACGNLSRLGCVRELQNGC
jgi:hypothetical protein